MFILATQTAYNLACNYGSNLSDPLASLNAFNWLQINVLVILAGFMIAALVYSISNVFPTSMREKMKGASRYEIFQMVLALVIVLAIIAFASTTCQIGEAITASSQIPGHAVYANPMQWSESYLNNLLFGKGLSLFSSIYQESQIIVLSANVMDSVGEIVSEFTTNILFGLDFNVNLLSIYFAFSSTLTSTFSGVIVVVYGVVFILYLFLPIIQSIALTVVVPTAIILRSIPFAGPRFREAADSFLALAIAFYFILPLTLILDNYVITWLYTPCAVQTSLNGLPSTQTQNPLCNPYSEFTGSYSLQNIPASTYFQSTSATLSSGAQGTGILGLLSGAQTSFFTGAVTGAGGFGPLLSQFFSTLTGLPAVIINYAQKTAQYAFQGILLIGLDIAITIGFAQGLTKGLGSVSKILGTGPFWGNV